MRRGFPAGKHAIGRNPTSILYREDEPVSGKDMPGEGTPMSVESSLRRLICAGLYTWRTDGTPRSDTSPPDDEHEGRGEVIRQARCDGLARARLDRTAYGRSAIIEENQ
jgi:hypothetical protein